MQWAKAHYVSCHAERDLQDMCGQIKPGSACVEKMWSEDIQTFEISTQGWNKII